MVKFETRIYNVNEDGKIIGAEVTVYDEEGDKISTIVVCDETQLDELEEKLDTLDDTYVDEDELNTILTNLTSSYTINATKLDGHPASDYVLASTLENEKFTPKTHASPNLVYGGGTSSLYGHVKVRDNLTASAVGFSEALSSHQGYVLNNKITDLQDYNKKNDRRILFSRSSDGRGEEGTQIVVNQGEGNGIVARLECDDPNYEIKNRTIRILINTRIYERTTGLDGKTQPVTINLGQGAYLVTAMIVADTENGKNQVVSQKFLVVE